MTTSADRSLDRVGSTSGPSRSTLRSKLAKKLDQLRSQGLAAVLCKGLRDHVYRRRVCVILERFPEPGESDADAIARANVIVVEPGEPLPDLSRHFTAAQIAGFEATIREGCTGFFALKDDDVVGVAFGSPKAYYEAPERFWFPVEEGDVYMFRWLVVPGQRSFAVASRIVRVSSAHFAACGRRRLYCAVDTWNAKSFGSLIFMGYQEAKQILMIYRFLWWTWGRFETYPEPRFSRYQRREIERP